VATNLEFPLAELRVCCDGNTLKFSDLRRTLNDLGIHGDSVLTVVRVAVPELSEHRVLQGPLFKKPCEDPTSTKIIKIHRPVGSKLWTTGRKWVGRVGVEWLEGCPFREKPGWFAVEGSTFGQPGLLLEQVMQGEEEPLILHFRYPLDDNALYEMCLKPSQTITDAFRWICLRLPGLKLSQLTCASRRALHTRALRNIPSSWILGSGTKISETSLQSGDEFIYFYVGNAEDDLENAVTMHR